MFYRNVSLFFCFFFATMLFGDEYNQPLMTAIQHPGRLKFYAPYPQSAMIRNDGKIHADIGVFETNDYEKNDVFYLDMGMATLQMSLKYAYSDDSQMRIDLPVYHIYGGFMDNMLDWFHSKTGLLNGSEHDLNGKNKVFFQVGYPGHMLIDRHNAYTVLGNLQIENKMALDAHFFGTKQALTFGIKVPTSKKSGGFGTKKVDFMIGWLLQKDWQKDALFVNLNIVRFGRYNIDQIACSMPFGYFFYTGWQHRYSKRKSWLVEYKFASSPFHSNHYMIDSQSNVIDLAWRYKVENGHTVDIFISENLAPFYNSPDITIGASYGF